MLQRSTFNVHTFNSQGRDDRSAAPGTKPGRVCGPSEHLLHGVPGCRAIIRLPAGLSPLHDFLFTREGNSPFATGHVFLFFSAIRHFGDRCGVPPRKFFAAWSQQHHAPLSRRVVCATERTRVYDLVPLVLHTIAVVVEPVSNRITYAIARCKIGRLAGVHIRVVVQAIVCSARRRLVNPGAGWALDEQSPLGPWSSVLLPSVVTPQR